LCANNVKTIFLGGWGDQRRDWRGHVGLLHEESKDGQHCARPHQGEGKDRRSAFVEDSEGAGQVRCAEHSGSPGGAAVTDGDCPPKAGLQHLSPILHQRLLDRCALHEDALQESQPFAAPMQGILVLPSESL